MPETREPGFYWVKFYGQWEIAAWELLANGKTGEWFLTGDEWEFDSNDFSEIDETKLERKG